MITNMTIFQSKEDLCRPDKHHIRRVTWQSAHHRNHWYYQRCTFYSLIHEKLISINGLCMFISWTIHFHWLGCVCLFHEPFISIDWVSIETELFSLQGIDCLPLNFLYPVFSQFYGEAN